MMGGTSGTLATAGWAIDTNGVFQITMENPGGSYTSAPTNFSVMGTTGCSPVPSGFTAYLTHSVVIIGDTNTGIVGSAFGSRLVNVTVDCRNQSSCTAVEVQNGQEESGPVFVSAVNYSNYCLWVHGQSMAAGSDNSFAFQIECNGNYNASSSAMSTTTIPVEFDNTKSRGIIGGTINPVNSNAPVALSNGLLSNPNPISSCSNSTPTNTFTATANTAATLPSNWASNPPYGLSRYVTLAGLLPAAWNRTWPISPATTTSFNINGVGICPSSGGTGAMATATLLPSADVIVCSGTACAGGIDKGQNNPTQVSLTQLHTEHAGTGVFVTGSNTSVEILAPTITAGGNSLYAGVTIDGTNPPLSVNINSMLSNGTQQFFVVDGLTGTNTAPFGSGASVLSSYLSGTAALLGPAGLQPPVAVKTAAYSVAISDSMTTFDNTGATGTVVYTLPTPLPGLTYTFLQTAGHQITLTPSVGTIQASQFSPNCVNAASGHSLYTTATNASITIQAINTSTWRATSCGGAWSST
jgi:hypothetical protein